MVNLNKNILRSILITSYILIIGFIVYGISAIFGYLNTGADRSSMLHTEINKTVHYTPNLIWNVNSNEGRPIDATNLEAIENDYLDAWYVVHVANKTNTTEGLEDYYTESARKPITELIKFNLSQHIHIESTTLEHHPKLEFFSEDGQLAVLTDHNVVEYQRIFKENQLINEVRELSTYKIILLLEDGFWRIRHKTKIESKMLDYSTHSVTLPKDRLVGINYYPKDSPWDMFGDKFSEVILSKDFELLHNAGINTLRIFVQYDDFGGAHVSSDKIDKLKKTLDIAEQFDLKVMVTLFDFYGNYEVLDWTLNMKHAEQIVKALKAHNALLGWDIKNEPNLDFKNRGRSNVLSWLENMINHVKFLDPKHPVTIGWSNIESAKLLKNKVDLVTFHYYDALSDLEMKLNSLKDEVQDKPILLGEFGMSSYSGFWKPFGNSDDEQANYHKTAQELIKVHNLHAMSWTLYDFDSIPKEVVGSLPWRKSIQKHFGFIDNEGNPKLAFPYIATE